MGISWNISEKEKFLNTRLSTVGNDSIVFLIFSLLYQKDSKDTYD